MTPNQEAWNECPDGAKCYGNWSMVPEPGYWRSSIYSDKFWKCPYNDACLGSPVSLKYLDYTGACLKGYKGNMCHSWDSGYSRTLDNQCS